MADEIGRAFQKVGGSAGALNLSFEKVSSWIAVVSSRTRESAETIGQSVKSILARIQSLRERGFDEEDGTQVNQVAKSLNEVGIALLDSQGQFRDFGIVMDELGEIWGTLDTRHKAYIATTLAGTYQQSRFLNLMEGYSETIPLYEQALESAGTTQQKFELYQEGTGAAIDRVKASMEGLWQSSFNPEGIRDILNLISGVLDGITALADKIGLLTPIILIASTTMFWFNKPFRDFVTGILPGLLKSQGSVIGYFKNVAASINDVGWKATWTTGALKGLGNGLKVLAGGLVAGAIFAGINIAISKFIEHIQEQKQAAKEAKEINYEYLSSLKDQKTAIEDLSSELEELQKLESEGSINTEQRERLLSIQRELVEQYGIAADGLNAEGIAYASSTEAIKERVIALEEEIAAENELNRLKLLSRDTENSEKIADSRNKYEDYLSKIEETKEQIKKLQSDIDSGKISLDTELYRTAAIKNYGDLARAGSTWGKTLRANNHTYSAQQLLEAYSTEQAELQKELDGFSLELQTALSDRIPILTNFTNQYISSLEENGVKISDKQRLFFQEIIKSIAGNGKTLREQEQQIKDIFNNLQGSGIDELISNYEKSIKKFKANPTKSNEDAVRRIRIDIEDLLVKAAEGIPIAEDFRSAILAMFPISSEIGYANLLPVYDALGKEIGRISGLADEAAKNFVGLKEKLNDNGVVVGYTSSIVDLKIELSDLSDYVSDAKEEIELIADAEKELKETNFISIETLEKLNKKYKDFIDITKLSKEETIKLLKIRKEDKAQLIKDEIEKTNILITQSRARIEQMREEQDAIRDYLEARIEQGDLSAEKQWMTRSGAIDSATKQTEELEKEVAKLSAAYADLMNAIYETDKEKEKSKKTTKETTEELSKLQRQINSVEDAVKKIQNQYERYSRSSQKYRDALAKENSLLEKKKSLLEEGIKNPVSLLPVKTETSSSASSSSSNVDTGSKVNNMLVTASTLQGRFKYDQVAGKFKGTYDEFVKGAVSDCSQFVQEMFDEFLDIKLPRTAAEQAKQGTKIDRKDLQPGDLVFFNTTGKDNSHVGIYMGDSKFIQMGNSGLKEQNINSGYWDEKYQGARRVVSGTLSSSGTAGTAVKSYTSKELEEARNKAKDDTMSADDQIYQNRLKIIDSWSEHYQRAIDDIDRLIRASERNQSNFTEFTPEWRKEQEEQIRLLEERNKTLHEQRNQIKYLSNEWGIESDNISDQIKDITENQEEIKFEISEKQLAIINSYLEEFSDRIADVGYELDLSKAKMDNFEEGSVEYAREMGNQIALTKRQIDINKNSILYLEQQIKSERLSAAAKHDLTQKVRELVLANYDLEKSNKDLAESYADTIINDYKKLIEKERDLRIKAIDEQIKAEEKRHKEFMDNIDEEDRRFEEYINRQIKLLDRQSASEDYESELKKKLNERQEIQDSINTWSMDNSMEGKAKRKELQEQLNKVDEEIERFKLERERVLRKEGLQDQLDDRKKYNEKVKKDEDKAYENTIDNIETEKKKTEQKFKDMLENEQRFYNLKQGLLSEDARIVKATMLEMELEYDRVFGIIKNHAFETSQEYKNMSYELEKALDKLKNFPSEYPINPTLNTGNSGSKGSNQGQTSSPFTSSEQSTIDKMKANSKAWAAASDKVTKEKLAAENLKLGSNIGAIRDEKTGIWYKNGIRLYHKGGEVGVEGTTTKKWFDKLLQSNEVPAILKQGEVVLDKPLNFINDIVGRVLGNITAPFKKITPATPATREGSASSSGGVIIEKLIIQANDKDTASTLGDKMSVAIDKQNKLGLFRKI